MSNLYDDVEFFSSRVDKLINMIKEFHETHDRLMLEAIEKLDTAQEASNREQYLKDVLKEVKKLNEKNKGGIIE